MVAATMEAAASQSSSGRPVAVLLAKCQELMSQMVEVGRRAAKTSDVELREELEAAARASHAMARAVVTELRAALRGARALLIERYPRNGGRVRVEMSDFPAILAGKVDVRTPSGTSWGELSVRGVRILLCHVKSIQVIR